MFNAFCAYFGTSSEHMKLIGYYVSNSLAVLVKNNWADEEDNGC